MKPTSIATRDASSLRAAVGAAREALAALVGVIYQVGTDELGELLGEIRGLSAQADAASVLTVGEAQHRGAVGLDGTTPAARGACRNYVLDHTGGSTDPIAASKIGVLATLCGQPSLSPLADAVTTGAVGLLLGRVALAEYEKLAPDLLADLREEAVGWFTEVARGGDLAQLRQLRPSVVARYGDPRALEHQADRLRERRFLSHVVQDDGLWLFHLGLDPEQGARLDAAVNALAAPSETIPHAADCGHADDEMCVDCCQRRARLPLALRDLRSFTQRRADALIALVERAVTAGAKALPAFPKAQLVVTVPFDTLIEQTRGSGTVLGQPDPVVLDPTTVRKIACDAQILPVVLGTDAQPLDLGRAKRLATPGQVKALWLRDRGCTWPGCHAPPAWTEAHHLVHWVDGGPTDLTNLTLLCGHHHTRAHQLGASATVTPAGVGWHLPGLADPVRGAA